MAYTNSPLVAYTKLSPNHSGQRTHKIDRITPHCVVGQLSAERICGCFTSPQREASCNYGIGTDGRVSLCVEEKNRSWCSSSRENDQRAITIECASDREHPYAMKSAVYQSLINLCVDICKRNGISKLLWLGSKEKTLVSIKYRLRPRISDCRKLLRASSTGISIFVPCTASTRSGISSAVRKPRSLGSTCGSLTVILSPVSSKIIAEINIQAFLSDFALHSFASAFTTRCQRSAETLYAGFCDSLRL